MTATREKRSTLSLRDFTDEMLALDGLAALDEGEWTDEHQQLADELATKLATKADDFWEYRLTIKANAEAARSYAADISARASAFALIVSAKAARLAKRVEWLDRYAMAEMERSGRPHLQGEFWKVRMQRNGQPSVNITAPVESLPVHCTRTIPAVVEADKKAIATAILAGEKIDGCSVSEGSHGRAP